MTAIPKITECSNCGAELQFAGGGGAFTYTCGSTLRRGCLEVEASELCRERRARQKAEAEIETLTGSMQKAEDLIKGLHDGWKKARNAHLETCKNAQAEINKLHTENVCLQELLQEFYEWSRRDYPTEAEVRDIMNRYYNLLNK
jgi:hypothetical protein